MLIKQFQKVEGLKPVVKLPVPMAAKQMDVKFSIFTDDHATHTGQPGDYLMQGIKGELYVCRKDVFEACYTYVESAPTVEVEDGKDGFRFRLVKGDRVSHWATYTGICTLDGYAAITGYYGGHKSQELVALPVAEIMEIISHGEVK